jgi:arsenite methyltransferase
MRTRLLFRLLAPVSDLVARQLSEPRGWFGRTVMTRVLNRGNRDLIEATLGGLTLGSASRLLDVGFGGGGLLALARSGGVRSLTGIDPSEAAIRGVQVSAPRWLAGADLRLLQGRVEAMPFPEAAFDAVASTNTVYFWPDPPAAFAELARVLAPGGQLALGFSGAAKLRSFTAITRRGFHFHDERALVTAAAAAGFTDVRLVELQGKVTRGDYLLLASRR